MKTNIELYILSKSKWTTVLLFGIVLLFTNISNLSAGDRFDGCQDPIIRRVFYEVDQKPTYPGGEEAMLKFINNNLCYPGGALDDMIEGTVYVRFVVEKDGSLTELQVLRGISSAFDKAAVAVIKQMPKWKPAKKDGKVVASYSLVNVKFDLQLVKICDDLNPRRNVLYKVDQMPTYIGGEKAMQEFIKENLNYPQEAQDERIEGVVYVRFIVEKDGSITDVQLVRGIAPICDKAAVAVIRKMPRWKPGKDKGKTVAVYQTVRVEFELELAKTSDTIERLIPKGYLYVVGNREMSQEEVMKIKKEDFESMEKLREDHVKYLFKKYGYSLDDKRGIILINLKKKK